MRFYMLSRRTLLNQLLVALFAVIALSGQAHAQSVEFRQAVADTIARLETSGHDVLLVAQSPTFQSGGWMREMATSGAIAPNARALADDFRAVNAALSRLASQRSVALVDPTTLFCEPGTVLCDITVDGAFVYSDRAHVTPPFSRRIGRLIADALLTRAELAARL